MTKKEAIKLFRESYNTQYAPSVIRRGYLPTSRFLMWRLYINDPDYPVAGAVSYEVRNGWKNPF